MLTNDVKKKIQERIKHLRVQNEKHSHSGDISAYKGNCRELKGIDFVMQRIK